MNLTRREILAGALAALPLAGAANGPIVDTRVELVAGDPQRFPVAPGAPRAEAFSVEQYLKLAASAGIIRAVLFQPEVYRDDHRYLEFCFTREPERGFFKGECWYDAATHDAADKVTTEIGLNPKRFVALRQSGRGLDFTAAATKATWRRAMQLKLALDVDLRAAQLPALNTLLGPMPELPVILDHMGGAEGASPTDMATLAKLGKRPKTYLRWTPGNLAQPVAKKLYDSFGPDRIIAGGYGHDKATFDRNMSELRQVFDFAGDSGVSAIRGGNALKLFDWA